MAWRPWVGAVVRQLRELGDGKTADALEACGRRAAHSDCPRCDQPFARVVVMASCDTRICSWCGRRAAKERTECLQWCVRNVRRVADGLVVDAIKRLQRDGEKADARAAHWEAKLERARASGRGVARAEKMLARAVVDANRARSWVAQIGHRNDRHGGQGWRWRFLTLTHWADPSNPATYTPEAMRKRVRALFRQWAAAWSERLSVGGVAAATVKAEISGLGHVHLHALYWGPWIVQKHSERVQAAVNPLAGFTWVQEANSDGDPESHGEAGEFAAREVAKYTAKAVSPLSREWIAGERRTVLHPKLAAAWQVATKGLQLVRHFGAMRDAVAQWTRPDDDGHWRCCTQCGHDLGMPGLWSQGWTDAVAREARDRWRDALSVRAE